MATENEAIGGLSRMASNLIPSEIIKLGNEINLRIKQGEPIQNLTIGDFDPQVFRIPDVLEAEIIAAYQEGHTNYPMANGIPELRNAVAQSLSSDLGLQYSADEILIAGGSRPLIYACYISILNPGDKVIYPVPSWNNNHYCHLAGAQAIEIKTAAVDNFMPTADQLKHEISDAHLLALCSPLNPSGTMFSKDALSDICALVVAENKMRSGKRKPLYIMYDQMYWQLTFGENTHVDPVSLFPELREYTLYIDGISKTFASTGVRVGWSFGPKHIIDAMRAILSHIGAWAPKAEQVATARFLSQKPEVNKFLDDFKPAILDRLISLYEGIKEMEAAGMPVTAIKPQGAIYLTVQFDLVGKQKPDGNIIQTVAESTQYLLDAAKVALVPFKAFGDSEHSNWYRISVGTIHERNISTILNGLRNAIAVLK